MRLLPTIAAFSLALPLTATAQDDPIAAAVKARQSYFNLLGANMGTLAGMARGQVPYDEAAAAQAGANLEALVMYDPTAHFPEGSSADELGSDMTAAKANIWTDMDGFVEKFTDLQMAAEGAGMAVTGGQANVGGVIGNIGAACKACHDDYRAK